ncbi:MAG TPA: class I SAM-dependent methyltransferase [Candidatus Dormibacteraeota bacterium]
MTPTDHEYWEERTRLYGARAAGYSDVAMDAYEDRLRRAAIERLVGRGEGRRLLDAGCGSGRWSIRLAKAGWVVTGADISHGLLALAPSAPNVTYVQGSIQDLDLPTASFDAVLSVTVLQHITDDHAFDAAVDNLMRMLRPAGTVAVLEYAPLRVFGTMPGYMRARSRTEWVLAFTSRGCRLRAETGVRFLGHGPYMLAVKLARRLRPPTDKETPPAGLNPLRVVCQAVDLALARIPGLTLTADVRLLVFEKAS